MSDGNGSAPTDPKVKRALDVCRQLNDDEMRELKRELITRQLNGWIDDLSQSVEQTDPWEAFTLADAYQKRPPRQFVAAGLFAKPSLNILYGAPGSLKSLLLADLYTCAAIGAPWLSPAPHQPNARSFKTTPCPVMWIDFDNGRDRTHERIGALARARNIPQDTQIYYYSMPTPWLAGDKKESIGALIDRIKAKKIELVCIDNLGCVSGDADENSAEMGQVMGMFRQVAEDTGAAIVIIHHQRKSSALGTGRAGDALRGHSSIEAALDLALLVEREENADLVNIRATKVRGPDVLPFSALFTYEVDPDDPERLYTARFYGAMADDNQSSGAIEREILGALTEPKNQKQLINDVKEALGAKVGIARIREMIQRLDGHSIRSKKGERNNEIVYYVPGR